MDRIGQFVIRECGQFLQAYRIVGYDFEQKCCIMTKISIYAGSFDEMVSKREYVPVLDTDVTYSVEEAIEFVKNFVAFTQIVADVLISLEKGSNLQWAKVEKNDNYKNEVSHLYNTLDNVVTTLHHFYGHESHQAYKEYKKALKNIKKRFYFYFGESGKITVDCLSMIANGATASIKERKRDMEVTLMRHKKLLMILEDYVRRIPTITHP